MNKAETMKMKIKEEMIVLNENDNQHVFNFLIIKIILNFIMNMDQKELLPC